jgi:hypothetical protein
MPNSVYIGDDNGVAQKMPKPYIGDDNGIAQKVVKAYIGDDNGIAQLCYIEAKAQVALTGISEQIYFVIGGKTYDSGDVTLELEYGTPVDIHFLETEMMNTHVYINSNQLADAVQNCYPVRYVVTGDVGIACSIENGGFGTTKKAIITEADPKANCFVKRTNWNTGETDDEVFCFRNGMTWAQFVDSMYNDGSFTLGDGNVYRRSAKVLKPSDDSYTSGYPVNETDTIINLQRYI